MLGKFKSFLYVYRVMSDEPQTPYIMNVEFSISVSSVKVVDAGCEVSRYQSSRLTKHSTEFKKLLVNGFDILTGNPVYFFTPSVSISKSIGFVNWQSLRSTNGWFKEIKGEINGYKGHSMFDGGDTPNIAIVDSTEIKPSVSVGDVIKVKGIQCYISPRNGSIKLNRVKLVA